MQRQQFVYSICFTADFKSRFHITQQLDQRPAWNTADNVPPRSCHAA